MAGTQFLPSMAMLKAFFLAISRGSADTPPISAVLRSRWVMPEIPACFKLQVASARYFVVDVLPPIVMLLVLGR